MCGYWLPKLCNIVTSNDSNASDIVSVLLNVSLNTAVCYSHSSHGFGDRINALITKRKQILGRFRYLAGGLILNLTKAAIP